MSNFIGGPADGKSMMIRRAPLYLRVVQAGNEFDALDQLDDEARKNEQLFAYKRFGDATLVHILHSPRAGSGWFQIAVYHFIEGQPGDATMRDTARWRRWCQEQGA